MVTPTKMEIEGTEPTGEETFEVTNQDSALQSLSERREALTSQAVEGGASIDDIVASGGSLSVTEPTAVFDDVAVGDDLVFDFSTAGTGSTVVDNTYAAVFSEMREQTGEVELASEDYLPTTQEVQNTPDFDALLKHESSKWWNSFVGEEVMSPPADEQDLAVKADMLKESQQIIENGEPWEVAALLMNETDNPITQEQIAQLAAAELLRRKMGEHSVHERFFDNLGDTLLGVLGVPTLHLAIGDVTGQTFGASEAWDIFVNSYGSLSPQEKVRAQPGIYNQILESTGGDIPKTDQLFSALTSADKLKGELFLEGVFVAVDSLLVLGSLMKPIKAMKKVGSNSRAAEMNARAIDNPEVREAAGETPTTVAMNTSPFNYERLTPEATDGIAADTVNIIERERQQQAALLHRVGEGLPERSTLKEAEQAKAQEKAIAEIQDPEGTYAADNARIVSSAPDAFVVEYTIKKGKKDKTITRRVAYTKNDVGEFDQLESGPVATKLLSPEVWMEPIHRDSVAQATLIDFTEGRTLRTLTEAGKNAYKGLKKDEVKRLDGVLLYGDEIEKEFSLKELVSDGITVPNQGLVRLTPKEASAYYKTRQVFDELKRLKDRQLRRDLEFGDFGAIQARHEGKLQTVYAKPTSSPNVKSVYGTTKRQGMTKESAEALVKEGNYEWIAFRNPIKVGDEYFDYGVAPIKGTKGGLRELPPTVLKGRKGYVPLIREDAYYFVKSTTTIRRNGQSATIPKTERYFDNRADAEAWAEKQRKANPENTYIAHFDRDMSISDLEDQATMQFGGLFGSSRTDREILKGLGGDESSRVSVIEAMDRNISHIARALPINNFRLEMIERWRNSASKVLSDPSDWNSALDPKKINVGSKEAVALEASRDWLRDQLRIPTQGEIRYSSAVQRIAEFMEGKPFVDGWLRKKVLDMGHTDPFAAMRSAAFHPLLGFFNPSQLFVQAQNASIAISIYPEMFATTFPKFMALRAGMAARKSPEALRKIAESMPGVDADDFIELVREFDETGLFQSLQSTADYNAHAMGYGVGAGAMRNIAQQGLLFFREGELFGRGYAWLISRERYIKANKLKGKKLTQKQIDDITTDAVRHNLNLNRANRAHWQKGAWSVPTQFKQITAKYIEAMLPKAIGGSGKFTGKEQARIMLGQFMMYGAAGVPLGTLIGNGYLKMTGQEVGSVDDTELAAIGHGIMGVMQEMAFGDVLQVSNRFAMADGINEAIKALTLREVPDAASLLGPFGSVGARGIDAIKGMYGLYIAPDELEFSQNELDLALNEVAPIISTFGSVHRSFMWQNMGGITTKDGMLLHEFDPENQTALIWAKRLGFQSAEEAGIFGLNDYNKTREVRMKKVVDSIVGMRANFLALPSIPTDADNRNLAARTAVLLSGFTREDRAEVLSRVGKKLQGDTMFNRNLRKMIDNYLSSGNEMEGVSSVLLNATVNRGE